MNVWLRWGLIILGLVIIFALVGYLQSEGIIPEFGWQGLTMVFAAFAAPFKAIFSGFGSQSKLIEQLTDKHKTIREQESVHRQDTDQVILEKETKIKELDKKLEEINRKIETIETKKTDVLREVETMSDQEKQNEAMQYWG